MNRLFKVTICVEADTEFQYQGLEKAREDISGLGFIVHDVDEITDFRTIQQNRSLHLLFKQLSDEAIEKGIDMREIVREEIPIDMTPENVKWLWKKIQKAMYGTKSTTKMKKEEVDKIYDMFNKILTERTKGELSLPQWPSIESY